MALKSRRCLQAVLVLLWHASALMQYEDWLVHRDPNSMRSTLASLPDGTLLLSNGLVERRFTVSPNFATMALGETGAAMRHQCMLRGYSPEARIGFQCPSRQGRKLLLQYAPDTLEGTTDSAATVAVGGVRGQERLAYLDPWIQADGTSRQPTAISGTLPLSHTSSRSLTLCRSFVHDSVTAPLFTTTSAYPNQD